MIVDAHVHIGKSTRLQIDADAAFLVRTADELGFDKICCTDLTALFYDMHEGNHLLYEQMLRYPDRIIGYASLHSTRFGRESLEELDRCHEVYGMRGLKIYSTPEVSIAEPAMIPILEKCVEHRLPVLAHATPAECEYLMERVPEAVLMMAHGGGQPYAKGDWNRAIMAAQKFSNLFLETASSTVDSGFVTTAVETLGAEKVVFGTDTPLLDPYVQQAKIANARLDGRARELVMGGNILRLMDLAA